MRIKKKSINNIFINILLIITLSCQNMPAGRVVRGEEVQPALVERENLPPDEAALSQLKEASELANSFRQKLITLGISNFSFNDWQIANTLYNRTVQYERTNTIRETQESTARYQLTADVLEALYLSASNQNPMGGGVTEDDYIDTYWYFDDIQTASAVPPPGSLIITEPQLSSFALPQTAQQSGQVQESDRQPGTGLFIADSPTREERRAMTAAGIPYERTVVSITASGTSSAVFETQTSVSYIGGETSSDISETQTAAAYTIDPVTETVSAAALLSNAAEPASEIPPAPTVATQTANLPAQYRVSDWITYKDCLWNIALLVYNDPYKWVQIYNANKHRMPEPDNPNLIEPGMILDIPSIQGELRSGIWYASLGNPPAFGVTPVTVIAERKEEDELSS